MILRLANAVVMAIAVFYAVEGMGLVEKGRYFPTLPRLEASAGDPYAWLGAAQWGFSQLGQLAVANGADSFNTHNLPNIDFGGTYSGQSPQAFLRSFGS